ncbi:hypothetical protein [Planomonospora sp. ID67723]|uniref:hypothetical protein n=1 Tax=Planomonospora sp. ID67723 TaxID=2738134 RepID=UPI0018C41333|nr:hypothetical protein [Planomonospora sp. ID67723]
MDRERGRTADVVVTAGDDCLGTFGPFPVDSPWWADVEPVAAHLTAALGAPVMVLRLIGVTGGEGGRGGRAAYHAEIFGRPRSGLLGPPPPGLDGLLDPAPRRAGWATAAGLRAALEWARQELLAAGRPARGDAEQVKTWNLSGLFRIPTAVGPAWLKATPGFATWEAGAMEAVARVDPELVPGVIAADAAHGWTLLDHVPGEDCWEAPDGIVRAMVGRWAAAQAAIARHRDGPRTACRTAPRGSWPGWCATSSAGRRSSG